MLVTCSKMYSTASIIKEGIIYTFLMFFCDVYYEKKKLKDFTMATYLPP